MPENLADAVVTEDDVQGGPDPGGAGPRGGRALARGVDRDQGGCLRSEHRQRKRRHPAPPQAAPGRRAPSGREERGLVPALVLALVRGSRQPLAGDPVRAAVLRRLRGRVRHGRFRELRTAGALLRAVVVVVRDVQRDPQPVLRGHGDLPAAAVPHVRLRVRRDRDLPRARLRRRVLRGARRDAVQGPDPAPARLAALDQLPDAHLRVAGPARARRTDQRPAAVRSGSATRTGWRACTSR